MGAAKGRAMALSRAQGMSSAAVTTGGTHDMERVKNGPWPWRRCRPAPSQPTNTQLLQLHGDAQHFQHPCTSPRFPAGTQKYHSRIRCRPWGHLHPPGQYRCSRTGGSWLRRTAAAAVPGRRQGLERRCAAHTPASQAGKAGQAIRRSRTPATEAQPRG